MTSPDDETLRTLARYRPTERTLTGWDVARRGAVLDRVLDSAGDHGAGAPVRWRPRSRSVLGGVGGLAAAATVAAVVVATVGPSGRSPGTAAPLAAAPNSRLAPAPGGASAAPIAQLADAALDAAMPMLQPGQYVYRVDKAYAVEHGRRVLVETNRSWVDADGDDWAAHRAPGRGADCWSYPFVGAPNPDHANAAYFASLPTEVSALNSRLRSQITGGPSLDAEVFTVVRDVLDAADGLASADLRAAFVGVLGVTPNVTVRTDTSDPLGRSATRVDYTAADGSSESLYFDPGTARLLGSGSGGPGSSGDYDAVTVERTVDALPDSIRGHCPLGGN